MVTQSTIFRIIIFYYQVVIIKDNHKSTWWYSTSMFEHNEQASPISESVAEIRINSHLARYQCGNTTHVSHEGNMGCRPTQRPSTLLSLWDPINLVCVSTQLNACCNRAQPTRSLINIARGYHLRSSEYENGSLSTFPSSILHFPLVSPPGLT
jgi:hypothetical protein